MDFQETEDQEALRGLARKILAERATSDRIREVEREPARIDRALWRELAQANLLGAAIPEAHGGMGFGLSELHILLEECGRHVAPIPVYPTLGVAAPMLAAFASAEQRERWLPDIASGEAVWSAALSESGGPVASAEPASGGWRVSGTLPRVAAGDSAARILVPARTPEGPVLLLAVDPAAEGVGLEAIDTLDRQARSHVTLDAAPVPDADVVADAARGEAALSRMHEFALLGLCALQVGVCEAALDRTAAYVSERRQFGRPIGSFQAVHTRAADAFVDLQAMKLTSWRALHLVDGEHAGTAEALAIAKFWASEGGARVVAATQHLHGGIGVDVDYPLHRTFLWAREIALQLGGAAAQLARLGEALAEPSSVGA